MKEEELVLELNFSDLGRLQSPAVRRYGLCFDGNGGRIHLSEGERRESCLVPCANREECRALLQFLYENAVPLENWREILDDLLAALLTGKEAVLAEHG